MNARLLNFRNNPLIMILTLLFGLGIVYGAQPNVSSGYNSSGWGIVDDGLPGSRISMVSETDGWVLIFGLNTTWIYRWDGTSWNYTDEFNHPTMVWGDIDMVSANDGWIVRGGVPGQNASSIIYRWDGSSWNHYQTLTDPNGITLYTIDVVSANDIWTAGETANGSNYYHWNGGNWQLHTHQSYQYVGDIEMVSANDGWAVGYTGQLLITHWNGTKWNQVSSPVSTGLIGISFIEASDGWAVGSSWSGSDPAVIIHWNGSTWTEVPCPVTDTLLDISMVSTNDGWAVGNNGVILHWDGNSWKKVISPTTKRLTDVDMITVADGWIAGIDGLLRYYSPELTSNFSGGAPGSYFTLNGSGFPPDSSADITVNGQAIGNLTTDSQGDIEFILSTSNADEGTYFVTTSVNPSATERLILDQGEPMRSQDGSSTILDVPAGIALTEKVFLPMLHR